MRIKLNEFSKSINEAAENEDMYDFYKRVMARDVIEAIATEFMVSQRGKYNCLDDIPSAADTLKTLGVYDAVKDTFNQGVEFSKYKLELSSLNALNSSTIVRISKLNILHMLLNFALDMYVNKIHYVFHNDTIEKLNIGVLGRRNMIVPGTSYQYSPKGKSNLEVIAKLMSCENADISALAKIAIKYFKDINSYFRDNLSEVVKHSFEGHLAEIMEKAFNDVKDYDMSPKEVNEIFKRVVKLANNILERFKSDDELYIRVQQMAENLTNYAVNNDEAYDSYVETFSLIELYPELKDMVNYVTEAVSKFNETITEF